MPTVTSSESPGRRKPTSSPVSVKTMMARAMNAAVVISGSCNTFISPGISHCRIFPNTSPICSNNRPMPVPRGYSPRGQSTPHQVGARRATRGARRCGGLLFLQNNHKVLVLLGGGELLRSVRRVPAVRETKSDDALLQLDDPQYRLALVRTVLGGQIDRDRLLPGVDNDGASMLVFLFPLLEPDRQGVVLDHNRGNGLNGLVRAGVTALGDGGRSVGPFQILEELFGGPVVGKRDASEQE